MNNVNRATVVVKVGGREVARQQVRVSDGDTLELDVPVRDVAARCGNDIIAAMRPDRAQFRATVGTGREGQKKKDGTA